FAPADRTASARLAHSLNVSDLTATLLVNRGVREPADARGFLKPELSALINPEKFNDMPRAVDRLEAAVRGREKVAIFGDYDVDGTSGTAILIKLFALLGVPFTYRVPHRVRDGYGLNAAAVEAFAAEGAKVLVTIDCGTNDVEEIALARKLGMDALILDHHEPGAALPDATAIINPKLRDSTYGFTGICSAGISFKVAWALADRVGAKQRPGFEGFILDAMGLAALGTIADVCPLIGENRIYVRYGLDALRACRGKGLRSLLELARLEGKVIETFDVSFKLAPRLNALGRIGTAMDCIDLLVSDDEKRIGEILSLLEKSNRHRKGIEDEMFEQALSQVESEGGPGAAIILADARWHVGVVGIVAARLVDRFYRPSFVMAIDESGVARGSARSIGGLALHEALESCAEHLITHGGHAMAAGLSLKAEHLEAFRRKMDRHVGRMLTAENLTPKLEVDDEVPIGAVTRPVVRELERLAPHGPGNPVPLLVSSHVKVAGEPRLMGKKNDHLSLYLQQDGKSIRAVGFGMGDLLEPLKRARSVSVAFTRQRALRRRRALQGPEREREVGSDLAGRILAGARRLLRP
ncbi:MAG: single-stranded-DNA-specific exonuclease RecJ, partial [Planctomycetes bacterium]|nr:single-stranded-DNA-specific exonuclease RecJ [Planctomycetota bacterium]